MSGHFKLTAQEDHYLKNELIKQQLKKEFANAWNDNIYFLDNLGYPFSDPTLMLDTDTDHDAIDMSHNLSIAMLLLKTGSCHKEELSSDNSDKYPLLKFIFLNIIKTFPYFKDLDSRLKLYNFEDSTDIKTKLKGFSKKDSQTKSWTIEKHTSKLDSTNNNIFFRLEIMPFFKYMLDKNISLSSSMDRDELTKRKKVNMKIFRVLFLLLNGSLATTRENEYYIHAETDMMMNNTLPKNASEVTKLTGDELNKKIVKDLEYSLKCNEKSSAHDILNIKDQSFIDFKKKRSLNNRKLALLSGVNFSIIGVTRMKVDKNEQRIGAGFVNDNSSTKLGNVIQGIFSFGKKKLQKAEYESVNSRNIDSSSISPEETKNSDVCEAAPFRSQSGNSNSNSSMVYKFIIKLKYKSIDGGVVDHVVYRSYSEFKILHAQLKRDFPGVRFPALPHKYKHSTMVMNSDQNDFNENLMEDQDKNLLLDCLNDLFSLDTEEIMDDSTRKTRNERALNFVLKKDNEGEKKYLGKVMKSLNSSNKSINDLKNQKIIEIPRERLRVLLNHYLNATLAEIINFLKVKIAEEKSSKSLFNIICDSSGILNAFLTQNMITLGAIKDVELEDIELREKLSFKDFQNEIVFQKAMYLATLKLKNELSDFKNMVIYGNNEKYLELHFSAAKLKKYEKYWKSATNDGDLNKEEGVLFKLMEEFKVNSKLSEFPPIFNVLFKWVKLSLSSFIYNLFFTTNNLDGSKISYVDKKSSNSSASNNVVIHYELFNQIKKMHFMFPYTMILQILKISNPIIMIKKLLDFLLYQPPNLIPGFLTNYKTDSDNNGKSLLQFLFKSVLSHDLSNLSNEMDYIMQKYCQKGKQDMQIMNFVNECFENFLNTDFTNDSEKKVIDIRSKILESFEESNNSESLILLILSEDRLLNDASYIRMRRIKHFRDLIKESFDCYQELEEQNNKTDQKQNIDLTDELINSELYADIKKLFQLKVRTKDKVIIESIWEEPYLNNFLKKFLMIFFEPLIIIFSRNKTFKRSVSVFRSFMNDMIKLVDHLYEYLYLLNNGNEILLSIYLVISKYEDFVIEFLHESYLNDTENFFGNMITWVTDVLSLLKFFKNGEQHKVDGFIPQFDIESIINKTTPNVNIELLRKEIDKIIADVISDKLKECSFEETQDSELIDDVIQRNWKEINNMTIMEREDLNIFENKDLDEFYRDLDELEKEGSCKKDAHASQNFYQDSEIHKLELEFKKDLIHILLVYQASKSL